MRSPNTGATGSANGYIGLGYGDSLSTVGAGVEGMDGYATNGSGGRTSSSGGIGELGERRRGQARALAVDGGAWGADYGTTGRRPLPQPGIGSSMSGSSAPPSGSYAAPRAASASNYGQAAQPRRALPTPPQLKVSQSTSSVQHGVPPTPPARPGRTLPTIPPSSSSPHSTGQGIQGRSVRLDTSTLPLRYLSRPRDHYRTPRPTRHWVVQCARSAMVLSH